MAVNSLHEIGYIKREYKGTCYSLTDSGYCCNTLPADNWINKRHPTYGKYQNDTTNYELIPAKNIKTIRYYWLTANYILKEKGVYPRIGLEEWECSDDAGANDVLRILKSYGEIWDYMEKSPLLYWQYDNKIYFLRIGGWYCIDEFPKLKTTLKETFGQDTKFYCSFVVGTMQCD